MDEKKFDHKGPDVYKIMMTSSIHMFYNYFRQSKEGGFSQKYADYFITTKFRSEVFDSVFDNL